MIGRLRIDTSFGYRRLLMMEMVSLVVTMELAMLMLGNPLVRRNRRMSREVESCRTFCVGVALKTAVQPRSWPPGLFNTSLNSSGIFGNDKMLAYYPHTLCHNHIRKPAHQNRLSLTLPLKECNKTFHFSTRKRSLMSNVKNRSIFNISWAGCCCLV